MKILLTLPLLLLFATMTSAQETKGKSPHQSKHIKAPPPPPAPPAPPMAVVPPPPPPVPPPPPELPADYKAFLERNPTVIGIRWNDREELIIHRKSGAAERYNLLDKADLKAVTRKYGQLPKMPPPPPPPSLLELN